MTGNVKDVAHAFIDLAMGDLEGQFPSEDYDVLTFYLDYLCKSRDKVWSDLVVWAATQRRKS